MNNLRGKITLYLSAILYLVFNLRLAEGPKETLLSTLWQLVQTAPYVAGISYVIIVALQYMSDGAKVPWDRRFRIFFALGILAGLYLGIYEYAGNAGPK